MKFNQPHPKCWGFQVLVEIQIDIRCRNIGCICMPLQLRLDGTCIGFGPIRFPVQFGLIWFISHICLAFPYCKAMPGKPNWGLLRKYFNGNLKFIRLLARQRYCGALGPISAQTDFIFIHLRDFQRQFSEYGDNDDDAHAPISARNSRTSFGGSLGIWGEEWGPEIGNCRLGSCGCFMIYCLDTACVVLPLFPQPPQPPPFI